MKNSIQSLMLSLLSLCVWTTVMGNAAAEAPVDFGQDIRPLLTDKCYTCHGPDENQRRGGLRFDRKESAFGEADSGARAIVPGDLEQSELIWRITSDDESMRMPPPDSGQELTDEEIETLKRWVEQGAPWNEHWAFVPPQKSDPPKVEDESWVRNPIDAFVLKRLEQQRLSPEPPADRATLLRRVSFDLTGLPPSPTELDAFLGDQRPGAYERVVDRLLASQAYGEHMARYWLDAVRYGDTHGLHLDNYREMWPYRDWVISAFNRNLPFDQFIVDQLAGDLLPDPTDDQLIATGFNRCHVTTNEGGSIRQEVYVRNVVDRVATVGTVFMGLTLDCTRCHDHKYDPLTMKDFYSLFAYFNSLDGSPLDGNREDHAPVLRVPTDEQKTQLETIANRLTELQKRQRQPWPVVDARQQEWEQQLLTQLQQDKSDSSVRLGQWSTIGPFSDVRRYLWGRKHGPEAKEDITLEESYEAADGTQLHWQMRPEWSDGTVHQDLPGDMAANFLFRTVHSDHEEPQEVTAQLGSDDALKVYLNGELIHSNNVQRVAAPDQDQVTLTLKPGKNQLLIKIMNFGGASGFYFQLDASTPDIPADILEIVQVPSEQRTDEQQTKLRNYFRTNHATHSELRSIVDQIVKLRKEQAAIRRQVATTLIWKEKAEPVKAHLLKRGEYDQPGEEVTRETPEFLPAPATGAPKDRLGLAKWLTNDRHPLTARVAVNRWWQQLFGTGLVKTSEDFGTRGERPTHPELLDWLAVQLIDDNWNVKKSMKRLVMSATYRQSSRITPEKLKADPQNRLLSRGPRFRLDAEMLRDQALAISGLLVPQVGGPSVKPPQPDGLWFAVGYSGSNTVRFQADEDPEKTHRRSVYTFIKRTAPPPQMSTFDGPSREASCVRRERTNTPLQVLLLMNDPQYVEAAIGLAVRTLQEAEANNKARARYMFRLATARWPDAFELEEILKGLRTDLQMYESNPKAAQELLETATFELPSELDTPELAAWALQANMLLNLDEVVTKN